MRLVKPTTAALAAALVAGSLVATSPQADAGAVGYARAVTGIGDSYPAGTMGNDGNSYVERYGRKTGQGAINRAHSGWRTGDVLTQFQTESIVMRNVRDSRTVIVTIGANDIAQTFGDPRPAATSLAPYSSELKATRARLHRVLGMISKARGGNNSRVVVTTYNQIYLDGTPLARQSWAYRTGSERLTVQVNQMIMAECNYYRMACVDVYPTFQKSRVDYYLTPDGTHPNAQGHQVYANLIYAKVR